MKIVVLGATGMAGSRIVAEALARGHQVTGIARKPEGLADHPALTKVAADVAAEAEAGRLADRLRGHDVVVSALHFQTLSEPQLVGAVKAAGIKRLLVVGGAGSLEAAPGVLVIDTPDFLEAWRPYARPGLDFLAALKGESELEWTFISPSFFFEPGTRTGTFRLGTDQLLVAADGRSAISGEDFAVAMLDEIETPAHVRRRFTVGY
ncbi:MULTISPECIES: NAD(P)-dependent oxidoreductase [unclassified Xanthobacter]|uniref:NAD(P)-dependent oxidoreductase n=1 Tax=unclassified Xanthobacter TaxID=2623496 RepID=UPI001EDF35B4|nr:MULTISPECIES: NAD(P)H-binding protein [unclassified Xanthobacter]